MQPMSGMIFVSVIINTCANKIMAMHIAYTYMSRLQDSTNQLDYTNCHLDLKHTSVHMHTRCNNVTRRRAKAGVSMHWCKPRLRRSSGCKSVSACNTRDCIDWHKLCLSKSLWHLLEFRHGQILMVRPFFYVSCILLTIFLSHIKCVINYMCI